MVRRDLNWKAYDMLRFSWALFILVIVLTFPFIPETYTNIHIVLLLLLVFLGFVTIVIERRQIILVFPDNIKGNNSNHSPTWGDPKSHHQFPLSNPIGQFQKLYRLIINERVFYPYLDIVLSIGGLLMASVLLLISILNIFLILASVALYYVILDNLIKRHKKRGGKRSGK